MHMKTKTMPIAEEYTQKPLSWWGDAQEKSLTLAKWMSLYEAVNYIADKADEKQIPLEDIDFKPLDIRDYIESTQDIFLRKILEHDYKIIICPSSENSKEVSDVDIEIN